MRPRILVVDDDQVYAAGLEEWLEGAGYEIAVAHSFEDGRRALRERPPDLMILDVRLGDFNGLQLAVASAPKIPTIIVTGFDDRVLQADAKALGATYLLKPVDPEALLAMIAERVGPATPETPSPASPELPSAPGTESPQPPEPDNALPKSP